MSRLPTQLVERVVDDSFLDEHFFSLNIHKSSYSNIENYLVTRQIPPHFSLREKRQLVHKCFPYSWISSYLFYTRPDNIMRRCIRADEIFDIMKACYDEPCGGHFAAKRTTIKIHTTGYYWPTLQNDLSNIQGVVIDSK